MSSEDAVSAEPAAPTAQILPAEMGVLQLTKVVHSQSARAARSASMARQNRSGGAASHVAVGQVETASQASVGLHALTILVSVVAATAMTIAEADQALPVWQLGLWIGVLVALTCAAAVWCRRLNLDWSNPPAVIPVLMGLVLATCAWEPVGRWLFNFGRPGEVLVMVCLKHVVLGAAAIGVGLQFQRSAIGLSLFLMLFAASISKDRAVQWLAVVYAVLGITWLAAGYWETLRHRLLSTRAASGPRSLLLVAVAGLAVLLVAMGGGENTVTRTMRGFMPSSGGTGETDPFARSGVGDGDGLVAGQENIQTFAALEDAPFMTDDRPSLYDLFSEMYDEPMKPKGKTERAIGLPPDLAAEVHEKMAQAQQANRQFDTLRESHGHQHRHVESLPSAALLYIAGRTPLHLRQELYDVYDGATWFPEEVPGTLPDLQIQTTDKVPWLQVGTMLREPTGLRIPETHGLKIVQLQTNRIPSPAGLLGIHIDQMAHANMFFWVGEGVVAMDRETIPSLTTIAVRSAVLDPARLSHEFSTTAQGRQTHRVLPKHPSIQGVSKLAREWGNGQPKGWPEIAAVIERLKQHATLDPEARASSAVTEDGEPAVADFLLRTRRGPDYQFATAAAMLLRTLGYSTRLVTGFYARPDRYDARKRNTAVLGADVHTWAEVYMGAGLWATVEATPGYEVLGPPPSLFQQGVTLLWQGLQFLREQWPAVLLATTGALLVWWFWIDLRDLCWVALLRTRRLTPAAEVQQWWRLLDQRAKWAKLPRRVGETPRRFAQRLSPLLAAHDTDELLRFVGLLEEFSFGQPTGNTNGSGLSGRSEITGLVARLRQNITTRQLVRAQRNLLNVQRHLPISNELPVLVSGPGSQALKACQHHHHTHDTHHQHSHQTPACT